MTGLVWLNCRVRDYCFTGMAGSSSVIQALLISLATNSGAKSLVHKSA